MSNREIYIAYARKVQELNRQNNPDNRPSAFEKLEAQKAKIRRQKEIEEAVKEGMFDGK